MALTIEVVVEGHGDSKAAPVLLRRLLTEAQAWEVDVAGWIRVPRSSLTRQDGVRKAVGLAKRNPDCRGILVLFDSDGVCPRTHAPEIQEWAEAEARGTPCAVVMAHKEYEAWFLASVESLRGVQHIRQDAESHAEPEGPRGAKEQLSLRMEKGRGYRSRRDQEKFSARFSMKDAYARCRSFRKMTRSVKKVLCEIGHPPEVWPPDDWERERLAGRA